MAAGLVVPVSGPYTAKWNGLSLGTQNDDGYVLAGTYQGQEINATDAFGMTLVEAIWRGLNWRLRFRGLEFNKPGILSAIQTFGGSGNTSTTLNPIMTNIGDRFTKFSQALVLTAILDGPANGGPTFIQTLTATNAVVAPQSNVEYLMTSKVREAPFEFVLLPYGTGAGSGTSNVSFTTT